MRLSAASDHPLAELTSLWARAYADYFVPISDDPDELRRHIELNDIDLPRSVVAHDEDGRFVGLSLLGIRGDRGWIGGFGVALEFRRRGLSRELMAAQLGAARGAGVVSVHLEVLEQNWAQKVYAAAGFATRRRLHGLRGTLPVAGAPPPAPTSDSRAVLDAAARLHGDVQMIWQRSPATVRHALATGARAFLSRDGASSIVLGAHAMRVLDAAGDPDALLDLAAGLAPGTPFTVPNEPGDSALADALLARGFERVWSQLEMVVEL